MVALTSEHSQDDAQARLDAAWAALREEQQRMEEQLQLLSERRQHDPAAESASTSQGKPELHSKRSSVDLRT